MKKIIYSILNAFSTYDIFSLRWINILSFMMGAVLVSTWTFGFFFLNSERLELELKNTQSKIFELGGPQNYTFKELMEILLKEIKMCLEAIGRKIRSYSNRKTRREKQRKRYPHGSRLQRKRRNRNKTAL